MKRAKFNNGTGSPLMFWTEPCCMDYTLLPGETIVLEYRVDAPEPSFLVNSQNGNIYISVDDSGLERVLVDGVEAEIGRNRPVWLK